MSDEGERLARLEVMVEGLVTAMREHVIDHKTAREQSEEALATSKQAALLTAIGHRNDRATRVAAWIGGGVVVAINVADFLLKLAHVIS